MTGTSRPWWASGEVGAPLDDRDPVEAFRAARRAGGAGDDGAGPRTRDAGGSHGDGPDPSVTDPPHRPELCGICPLCSLARSLEETRPELVEHLTEAARHLAAAARALMEPPDPSTVAPRGPSERLQHIDLDPRQGDRTASDEGGGP
jgi:hypothetical protein